MTAARSTRSGSGPTSPRAGGLKRSCPRRRGRQRKARVTGRWSAAPWRRDLNLQNSNWRRRDGSRHRHYERSEAIQKAARKYGLLRRGARHRSRVRATRWLLAMTLVASAPPRQRFQTISLAAIKPPPAISTAAIAILALGSAKPARIRKAVESSGVA